MTRTEGKAAIAGAVVIGGIVLTRGLRRGRRIDFRGRSIANAMMPSVVATAMSTANRILPGPLEGGGTRSHSGWQSLSDWAPSALTRLTDRAAARNNEIPQRA